MKKFRLYLDDFMEELFFHLETVSDSGRSHKCDVIAHSPLQAANILSNRLVGFFEESFEEVGEERD